MTSTVIRLSTGSGTLVIETDDPGVKIAINGEDVTIRGGGVEELTLRPGQYEVAATKDGQPVKQELVSITRNGRTVVRISLEGINTTPGRNPAVQSTWQGWPADAPPLAIAPFDSGQAKAHQKAWAKYLGVPMEKEILLGRNRRGLDVKLSLVLIPPGEFLMGSSEEEIKTLREQAAASGLEDKDLDLINLQGPRHPVRITRPFYLSRHEVSTDQFRSFVQAQPAGYQTEPEASGLGAFSPDGLGKDPRYTWKQAAKKNPQAPGKPVVNITWNDANDCCKWLSQLDSGLTFALPTESQWEYAARAGTTTLWFTGDEESSLENYAVINTNWPQEGDRLPNAFGLCDVHGNVWEWCQDAFYDYRNAGTVDPIGAVNGEFRVIRGGSCFGGIERSNGWMEKSGCRSAARYVRRPDNPLFQVGFRVAAAIPDDVIEAAVASAPPPIVHPFASGEWIDVIPLIDPKVDKWDMRSTGNNDWRIEQGELVLGADDKPSKLLLPLDANLWPSFECEFVVTRRSGEQGFNLNIPAGTGDSPLCFDRPDNPGFNLYVRQKGEVSLTDARQIETGKQTTLRIEVRPTADGDRITVWNKDAQVGTWTGDRSQLFPVSNEGYPHTRRLSLWVKGGNEFVFHRIRVRTLDGTIAGALRPLPDTPLPPPC